MHAKRHCFLHWVLIIALAVLPVRAALAVNPGCGMHEHASSSSSPSSAMASHVEHMAMNSHAGHRMMNPVTGVHHMAHQGAEQPLAKHHCCCCDSAKGSCSPDCGMSLHASAIITMVFAMTVSSQSLIVAITADALQTRELTPPSRPPLSLYV
jgi:hypothetical protein